MRRVAGQFGFPAAAVYNRRFLNQLIPTLPANAVPSPSAAPAN
jgi:hypothetical protein